MSTALYVLLGIALAIVVLNVLNKSSQRKILNSIKKDFLGNDAETVISNLPKIEKVIKREVIGGKEYVVISTNSLRTLKIYEFEKGYCCSFFVQTLEMMYILPNNLNYGKEFNIIENDSFEIGIDLSVVNREFIPTFFSNGLTVEITSKRFAKIFRSIEHKPSVKTRPLYIYVVSDSVNGIDKLIDFVKDDKLKVLEHFNRDKMEYRAW
ncbi:hypothetical protein H4K35_02470 [Myroides sp. NP-2]|uniref:hypothetical protein n=1 Tax=Myroides sp. NP-2 TaxID=2759945 RepID=UPI0015F993EF|nr:hypothetical protein [Myroides sp. NP-2]MBB1149003.1 hypothetical protein [Myroides sp. NP-2]